MNEIGLYKNMIDFPSKEELQNSKGTKYAHLVYFTPLASSIIEYAGRTCYKSFDKITNESYKGFISGIVKSGHESVIEHSNLIYVILKPEVKKSKDSDVINRHMITLMMYNRLVAISESQAFYIISGNLRMFKDMIRTYFNVQKYNQKSNPILDDIANSFYRLPSHFFDDMVRDGMLELAKFRLDPAIKDHSNEMHIKRLNNYVSVLNFDKFTFKVRQYHSIDLNGAPITRRVSVPEKVMDKHNRLTLLINAPRYITHQIVRHRLCSYSQQSQRYCLENGVNVYTPESFKDKQVGMLVDNLYNQDWSTYKTLIDSGIPKEDARAVLPNSTMSILVMTATIEEFNWIIGVRADKRAQNFFRDEIATPIKEYIESEHAARLEMVDQKQEENRNKQIEEANKRKKKKFRNNANKNGKIVNPKNHFNNNNGNGRKNQKNNKNKYYNKGKQNITKK